MTRIFVICAAIYFLSTVYAHEWKLGNCPDVDVIDKLDYRKMIGVWYVIEKTKSASTCTTYEFIQYADGKKALKESARPLGIRIKDVMERVTQEGNLLIPNATQPAKMTVAFPMSLIPFTAVDFWILDTDYTTYVVTWSCRSLGISHRGSAMILSREEQLDREIINKLRDKLEYFGINKHSLSIIDQRECEHSTGLDPTELDPENNRDENENDESMRSTVTMMKSTVKNTMPTVQVHLRRDDDKNEVAT